MRKLQVKYAKGFSLMETLVAITVLVFGIIGPLTLAQINLRSFPQIRDRIIAEYLAAEGVDMVRNVRDTALIQDPDSGLPNFNASGCGSANGCYIDATSASPAFAPCTANCPQIKYDNTTGSYNYSTGADTIFVRRIFISSGNLNVSGANGEYALVTVRVEWPSRFLGTESVEFSSFITDWFRF